MCGPPRLRGRLHDNNMCRQLGSGKDGQLSQQNKKYHSPERGKGGRKRERGGREEEEEV